MLAQAEVTLGVDVGISETLDARLESGSIPVMEIDLRTRMLTRALDDLDVDRLIVHFKRYVEGQLFLPNLYKQSVERFNPLNPQRGEIPLADWKAVSQPLGEQAARDIIMTFAICTAIAGRIEAMTELGSALEKLFPAGYPGKSILDHWKNEQTTLSELDTWALAVIRAVLRVEHAVPRLYWTSGVCFVAWTRDSRFKDLLTGRLAAWQRIAWERIVASESFRLFRPRQTVPPIRMVLEISTDDLSFVSKLLLAAAESVDTSRIPGYREILKPLSAED